MSIILYLIFAIVSSSLGNPKEPPLYCLGIIVIGIAFILSKLSEIVDLLKERK